MNRPKSARTLRSSSWRALVFPAVLHLLSGCFNAEMQWEWAPGMSPSELGDIQSIEVHPEDQGKEFKAGDSIRFVVTFKEAVTVTEVIGGSTALRRPTSVTATDVTVPSVQISINRSSYFASYSGPGQSEVALEFAYVPTADLDVESDVYINGLLVPPNYSIMTASNRTVSRETLFSSSVKAGVRVDTKIPVKPDLALPDAQKTTTNQSTISLTPSGSSSYEEFCVEEHGANDVQTDTCTSWSKGDLPSAYTAMTTNGSVYVYLWLRDKAGNVSEPSIVGPVTIDKTAPSLASVTVTNSSPTGSTNFNLTYGTASEAYTQYCIRENNTDVSGCSWVTGSLPSSFTVGSTSENKTLSVWIQDAAGNVSTRADSNAVELDVTPPALASVTVSNASPTNSLVYTLTYGAVTGGTYSQYCILENNTTVGSCTWTSGNLTSTYTVSAVSGAKILSVWIRDSVGNTSTRVDSNSVTLDITAPTVASFTVTNPSPTNSTTYNLNLGAIGGTYSDYCILENSTTVGSCNWTSGTVPSTYTVTSTNNAKVLSVWIRDSVGNTSTRVDSNSVTLDTTAPTVTLTSPSGGVLVDSGSTTTLQWSTTETSLQADSAKLEFSADSGTTYTSIAANLPNSGSYSWSVPNTPTTSARIRISLKDTAGNTGTATSGNFTLRSPTSLAFTQEPSSSQLAGYLLPTQPRVSILDAQGTIVTSSNLTVTLTLWSEVDCKGTEILKAPDNTTSALLGSSATATAGVAQFSGVKINRAATALYMKAVSGTLAPACSGPIQITPDTFSAAKSSVTSSATTVASGSAFTVTVTGRDTYGNENPSGMSDPSFNINTTDNGSVSAVSSNKVNGVYTQSFKGVSVGSVTLGASVGGWNLSSTPSTLVISVTPGPFSLSKSVVSVSTSSIPSGSNATVTLKAMDEAGNLNPTAIETVAFTSSATAQGSYLGNHSGSSGTYTQSFAGAAVGTTTLGATINGTAVTSNLPTLTITAGDPTKLSFTQAPSSSGTAGTPLSIQPKISILDAQNNPVTTRIDTVTLTLWNDATCSTASVPTSAPDGTYALPVSSATATSGIAEFSGVKINLAASALYLKASSGSLASACAGPITVAPGAVSLSKTTISSGTSVNSGSSISVSVTPKDDFGNLYPSGVDTFGFFYSSTDGATGSFGATTVIGGNRSAPFTGGRKGQVRLSAKISGTDIASYALVQVIPGSPMKLAFPGTVPSTGVAGSCIGPFKVLLQDAAGNFTSNSTGTGLGVSVNGSGLTIYAADCTTVIPGFSIPAGSSETAPFYVKAGNTGTYPLTASTGNSSLTSATISLNFDAAAVSSQHLQRITSGARHSCALRYGESICWGDNTYGQLGGANPISTDSSVKVSGLPTSTMPISLSAGSDHTCALLRGGSVHCWGWNNSGQLGNSALTDSSSPVNVSGLSGAVSIDSGYEHSCAVLSTGTVSCWGRNDRGQLGNGSTASSTSPTLVSNLTGAAAVAAGKTHTCALVGTNVRCWGENSNGQLGDGTQISRTTSILTNSLGANALSLSAGELHTCALVSGGGVKCWGDNRNGQLGDGTTTMRSSPISVMNGNGTPLVNAIAISAGAYHTCAQLNDTNKTVLCWGLNMDGQLGNGSTVDSTLPVAVSGLTGTSILHFAAGLTHTCAILDSSLIDCWGSLRNRFAF